MSTLTDRLGALSPAARAALARKLSKRQLGDDAIARLPRTDRGYPLSFAQERMWYLHRAAEDSTIYHLCAYFKGPLDPSTLSVAFGLVVARHEAWRTTFHLEDGALVQRIHPPGVVNMPVLPREPGLSEPEQLERAASQLSAAPFDLSKGPLYRFAVLEGDRPDLHTFIAVVHHIAFDSSSVGILISEAVRTYLTLRGGAPPETVPLSLQVVDHAVWERETGPRRWARPLEGWRRRLEGAAELLELAADRPRPPRPTGKGGAIPLRLDGALVQALRETGTQAGATLFATLLAGFQVLLHRHSGQEDIVVGAPIATRGADPELRNLIGLFVNTVPLRSDLSGDPSFSALLGRVSEMSREALANADVPLGLICEALQVARTPDRHPLFQVIFDLQVGLSMPENLGLGFESMGQILPEGRAHFDLSLVLADEDGGAGPTGDMVGRLEYSADLYDHDTAAAMAAQLIALLRSAVADPEQPITSLSLLDAQTRADILERRGRSPHPAPADHGYAPTLSAQFEAMAARYPSAVAVRMGGGTAQLSYGELDRRANQLAHALGALGVGAGQLVALCMDRGPDLLVGMLGVLKAGAGWLPMEITWPWERIRATLRDASVGVVVTQSELLGAFRDTAVSRVVLDRRDRDADGASEVVDAADLDRQPTTAPLPAPGPDDIAYCIYTSGSTGQPKGVLVSHHNALRLFSASADLFQFSDQDVWSVFHAPSFDFSVWEIWGALLHGGRAVLVSYLMSRSPRGFAELLEAEGVSMLSQTPSALASLVQAVGPEALARLPLRCLVLGGEAFEPRRFTALLSALEGRARVVNLYGITETTVHVSYRPIRAADATTAGSPIGDALPDLRIYLLDEAMEPVPTGVPGEIWVGGAGVAQGYLGRPELSAARFVPNPFGEGRLYRSGDRARYRGDGELLYLGRADQQIKVRGFRVEPGEIEAALLEHPGVRDAAVVLRTDGGAQTLVAYVVPEGASPTAAALRQHLRRTLTDYMLPNTYVTLPALPLTANGKLDRQALPAPGGDRPTVKGQYVAPSGPLQQELAAIWKKILRIDRVGATDNFFELGGDSIQGAILIEELHRRMGEIVHVALLYDVQTLDTMAQWLQENCPGGVARLVAGDGAATGARDLNITAGAGVTRDQLDRFQAFIQRFEPRAPARRNRRAIFVLSPPRSGSTLLRVILGGHPLLFSPPELELLAFHTLSERLEAFSGRLRHWTEGSVRALMELMDLGADDAFAEEARLAAEGLDVPAYYAHLQGLMGERTLVDKTASYPLSPGVLAAAEAIFDEPLYIHLHRHPVDGVSSFLAARIDQLGLVRDSHDFSREQLAELVYTLSHENILRFLSGVPAHRQLRLAYEDLVTDPVGQIGRLCDLIGVEPAPEMLDPYTDGERRMTDGVRKDAGWTLGDVKFHHYKRIEANAARRWQRAGVRVALGAPTWEVAEALGYSRPTERSRLLVPLADDQHRRPFFCVHPAGGQILCYRPLARLLASKAALVAIQAEEFAGVEDPATTIEEIAARYVAALQTAQPQGPYLLGGWSLGGVVAYEMARQLVAAGQEVDRLLMIDSHFPTERLSDPAAREATLGALDGPLAAQLGLDPAALGEGQLPDRVGRALRRCMAALAQHRPGPYEGKVRLFRASRQLGPGGGAEAWTAVAPSLRSAMVPGHHYSVLEPPYVEELASAVLAELS